MNDMKKIYIVIFSMLSFACSEEFLDVAPSKSTATTIESFNDLDALLNFNTVQVVTDYATFFATDHACLPQNLLDENIFNQEVIDNYTLNTEVDRSKDRAWEGRYSNLRLPNLILDILNSGNLGQPISEEEIAQVELIKAECHFLRAYTFFELAVLYAKHYNSGTENEPGIVLKRTASLEESQVRSTLKETFDFIFSEIDEALKFPADMPKQSMFRIDKSAVHALAARVHLYVGDYTNAETQANTALSIFSGVYDMSTLTFDYNPSYWSLSYAGTSVVRQTASAWEYVDVIGDQYFYYEKKNPSWNISPSQELLDLYEPGDYRFRFYVKDWFTRSSVVINNDDAWWSYHPLYVGKVLGGVGVPEMYFTRAECKARKNDYAGAMADVEMVRIHRFGSADYKPLVIPISAKATVDAIIDERRREDPFEYRFMDIKRLNNDPLTDDIVLTRILNGETITIQPNSPVYARPIGSEVINLSGGETTQNQY